jgi:hypothetical protein
VVSASSRPNWRLAFFDVVELKRARAATRAAYQKERS